MQNNLSYRITMFLEILTVARGSILEDREVISFRHHLVIKCEQCWNGQWTQWRQMRLILLIVVEWIKQQFHFVVSDVLKGGNRFQSKRCSLKKREWRKWSLIRFMLLLLLLLTHLNINNDSQSSNKSSLLMFWNFFWKNLFWCKLTAAFVLYFYHLAFVATHTRRSRAIMRLEA